MKKINFAISVTTLGLIVFIILCSFNISIVLLQLFSFGLTGSLIWMVITILKNGQPPPETFDEKFYEDRDLGPH